MTTRPITITLVEALIIGVMNATLFMGITKLNLGLDLPLLHIITGSLIHLIFEYTGGNKWWCTQTYKL